MKRLWARLRDIDPLVVDIGFASIILIACLAGMTSGPTEANPTPIDPFAVALTVVGVGGLALRRRNPLAVLWVTIGTNAIYTERDYLETGLPIALIIALYTAATLVPRRQWMLPAGLVATYLVIFSVVRPEDLSAGDLVANFAIYGTAAAFGDSNATRRANSVALEARAKTLEENQAIEAERAVAEERLRIARQLHDVVAHALAVIAVQSGVGGHVIETDPAEAKRVLDNINEASRETLDEMRRMLGVLRGQDGERATELAPAPGLGDLDQLVKGVRDAGLQVDVVVTGAPNRIPAGVGLTAFRIIQEALTNALKHAGPARAEVRIDCTPGIVTIQVEDDGRGAAADGDRRPGTHLGLIGMQERVAAFEGELAVGPRTGGGWRVCATLPYERVDA